MNEVFLGSEVLRSGALTRSRLRWNYKSSYPDVYLPNDVTPSLRQHTVGAWLWSGRRGIVAGRAAAALHGALWVHTGTLIELISTRTRTPSGILARSELISDDELVLVDGMAVTNPARTAFDLARHLPRDLAVRHLDALARATGVEAVDVLALGERYRRARGRGRCAVALDLMDGGAQSPKETSLRLLVIDEGFPRHFWGQAPLIHVTDGIDNAFLDMGWDEPMIGLDTGGRAAITSRPRFVHDIGRNELVRRQGWLDLHVVAEHRRAFIVHRLDEAFARRQYPLRLRPGS
ncbi:MAG TPA: hypothetical protein VGO30_09135 [Mycobacterium sp.]|nr:hypothetical protein [Mycobacterium sp.]